jgi:VWFA-related protein
MALLTRSRVQFAAFCLFILASTLWAQAPAIGTFVASANAAPAASPDFPASETIRKRVDEVNVLFTVSNGSGKYNHELTLEDVQVLDNHLAPERISYFQKQTDLPLRVGILIDLSDSVTQRFSYEKKAATAFLQKVLRPQVDEAFIVGFGSKVELHQEFTSDVGALSSAVKHLRAGGDTRLYDAIRFAAEKLGRASGPAAARRAIILITDGEDTLSHSLMNDAVQAALRSETAIFALSSNDLSMDRYPRGEAVLELVTRPTGGAVLAAHNPFEIGHAFNRVKEALRNQYALGYKPANFQPDGSFRSIEITPRKAKLRVQCRRGYFAPREAETQDAMVRETEK